MKFESFLLSTLLVACIAVVTLIMFAMLTLRPAAPQLASSHRNNAMLLSAPSTCTLPADDLICPRQRG